MDFRLCGKKRISCSEDEIISSYMEVSFYLHFVAVQ